MYMCICVHIYMCIHVCVCIYTYMCIRIYTYTQHMCICVCVCVCVCVWFNHHHQIAKLPSRTYAPVYSLALDMSVNFTSSSATFTIFFLPSTFDKQKVYH